MKIINSFSFFRRMSLCLLAVFIVGPDFSFAKTGGNVKQLSGRNTSFALDLYSSLSEQEGNLFFSPYSISAAFAMAYAGAQGETAEEIKQTLHFSQSKERLHSTFEDLNSRLNKLQKQETVELFIANSLWPQKDYSLREEYLQVMRKYYDAEIQAVDYRKNLEQSRQTINKWVADKTQDKIKDLIPPGAIDRMARLVLANAIYFRGKWENSFSEDKTRDLPFRPGKEGKTMTPTMKQTGQFRYYETSKVQVLALPYRGKQVQMVIVLPREPGALPMIEKQLRGNLNKYLSNLKPRHVEVYLPRFRISSRFQLNKTLSDMGMKTAFVPKADFSAIDGTQDLYISAAIHKAFVDVDEKGTEAAAATGIGFTTTSLKPKPIVFRADHPFLFIIRETGSESILFMGRVTNPS